MQICQDDSAWIKSKILCYFIFYWGLIKRLTYTETSFTKSDVY